jgi:hypothetical protein
LTAAEFLAATPRFLASAKLSESNMQTRKLDRAIIRVAKTTDMSGTATANKIKRGLRIGKGANIMLVACSVPIWSLMLTGLFLCLTGTPTRGAEEAHDRRGGRENEDKGIRAEIAAIKAQVTSLQSTVSDLQGQVTSLQDSNKSLQTQLAAVQSNRALGLGPFVSVVSGLVNGANGPHIFFTGANIHIVSGKTTTADNVTGLGNLIIGYNEAPPGLSPGDRGGSHNLVIGQFHRFAQAAFGGLVAGEFNTISNEAASVSGGENNTASGVGSNVSGGNFNTASGFFASVLGGVGNTDDGAQSSICGGNGNTIVDSVGGVVVGGDFNVVSQSSAIVVGGSSNTASGESSIVLGGSRNTAGGGGIGNAIVLGGRSIINDNPFSIVPKAPFP